MIRWEAPPGVVACSHCGATDTEVSFEFLAFTHRTCSACGATFVTIADPYTRERVFTFRFTHPKESNVPKPR